MRLSYRGAAPGEYLIVINGTQLHRLTPQRVFAKLAALSRRSFAIRHGSAPWRVVSRFALTVASP